MVKPGWKSMRPHDSYSKSPGFSESWGGSVNEKACPKGCQDCSTYHHCIRACKSTNVAFKNCNRRPQQHCQQYCKKSSIK